MLAADWSELLLTVNHYTLLSYYIIVTSTERVLVCIYLTVYRITQKLLNGLSQKLLEGCGGQGSEINPSNFSVIFFPLFL